MPWRALINLYLCKTQLTIKLGKAYQLRLWLFCSNLNLRKNCLRWKLKTTWVRIIVVTNQTDFLQTKNILPCLQYETPMDHNFIWANFLETRHGLANYFFPLPNVNVQRGLLHNLNPSKFTKHQEITCHHAFFESTISILQKSYLSFVCLFVHVWVCVCE